MLNSNLPPRTVQCCALNIDSGIVEHIDLAAIDELVVIAVQVE